MTYVVELSKEVAALVASLSVGEGLTFEEVQEKFNLTPTTANQMLRYLRRSSTNLIIKRRRGRIQAKYKALAPEFKVTVEQQLAMAAGKAAAVKPTGAPAVMHSEPSSNGNGHSAAELIWPEPPKIPSMKEEYGWYVKPDYHQQVYDHLFVSNHNLRFDGPPGGGKSTVMEVIAIENDIPLANINAESGLRYRDMIGHLTDLGTFEVADFAAAVVKGYWGKVDEANAMDPDSSMAFNSLLAPPHRIVIHGHSYPVHPDFRMAITYNSGLTGTKPLPESLLDRMYPIKVPFPSEPMLVKMMKSNGANIDDPRVKNLIQFSVLCNAKRESRETNFMITPRKMLYAWSDIKAGKDTAAAIKLAIIAGIHSQTDATTVFNIMVESSKSWVK